jgi:hypothetical protein
VIGAEDGQSPESPRFVCECLMLACAWMAFVDVAVSVLDSRLESDAQ